MPPEVPTQGQHVPHADTLTDEDREAEAARGRARMQHLAELKRHQMPGTPCSPGNQGDDESLAVVADGDTVRGPGQENAALHREQVRVDDQYLVGAGVGHVQKPAARCEGPG